MDRRSDGNVDKLSAKILASYVQGGLTMGLRGAEGITRLAGRIHATISSNPWPWKQEFDGEFQNAPIPYRIVDTIFRGTRYAIDAPPKPDTDCTSEPFWWNAFNSGLNCVVGDKLDRWDNPLSIDMKLLTDIGKPLRKYDGSDNDHTGLVVFLPGLGMSEQHWMFNCPDPFYEWLVSRGYEVAWLRYNSGRAIARNAVDFSELLDDTIASMSQDEEVILIGHSLGGLLIRSGAWYARTEDLEWPQYLSHAAYLASPHYGAPLEKIGEFANSLLELTPYTKPLKALGDIRSRAVKDLRYGRITGRESETDPSTVDLHPSARHYLAAGKMDNFIGETPFGDGMVPLEGALGTHPSSEYHLTNGEITRESFPGTGHMDFLRKPGFFEQLRDWLEVGLD